MNARISSLAIAGSLLVTLIIIGRLSIGVSYADQSLVTETSQVAVQSDQKNDKAALEKHVPWLLLATGGGLSVAALLWYAAFKTRRLGDRIDRVGQQLDMARQQLIMARAAGNMQAVFQARVAENAAIVEATRILESPFVRLLIRLGII
ncbi:hypothetical protein JW872_02520 [Candidatus Babeliales bacterium]|nr:hypothetical protein [Candidatus Babeliales bacterium]